MPTIFELLPFPGAIPAPPLDVIRQLSSGGLHPAPAPYRPHLPAVTVRGNQIVVWVALAHDLLLPSQPLPSLDDFFPVILDTGCSTTMTCSEWHLRHWARSASYDPFLCKVIGFTEETVANTPPPVPAPPGRSRLPPAIAQLHGQDLGTVLNDTGFINLSIRQNNRYQPKIASHIWLPRNRPGERDVVISSQPCHLLQIDTIICRPGPSARPPLVGIRAFTDGRLFEFVVHAKKTVTPIRSKPILTVDYGARSVSLEYP